MTLVERFEACAADFERSFADDDWMRLAQHFSEDAVYSTPASQRRVSGRDKLLAALREAVFAFDRRCDTRILVTTEGPREAGNEVLREWRATFTLGGAPQLEIEGSEHAKFRGHCIELLEVTLTKQALARLMSFSARYLASRSG